MNYVKSYDSTARNYDLNQIQSFFERKKLNFDLDCQRGYVWTEDQEQEMIDTLVCGERIPEVHCIEENNSGFNVIDGKQRLTTILRFINNKILWKKSKADISFLSYFGDKTGIYFSELPEDLRDFILSIEVTFAIYKNMTPKGITKLFKKLNNGSKLTPFQKNIANNILLRVSFSKNLLNHPGIQKLYTQKQINKDMAEEHLVSLLGIMLACDKHKDLVAISLQPPDLLKENGTSYILNSATLSNEELDQWNYTLSIKSQNILKLLDVIYNTDREIPMIKNKGQFVFPFLYAYFYELNEDEFLDLLIKISNIHVLDITNGTTYARIAVERWINYINNNILA